MSYSVILFLSLSIWKLVYTQQQIATTDDEQLSEEAIISSVQCLANQTGKCPLWYYCNSKKMCQCDDFHRHAVRCESNGRISLLDSYCATYDKRRSRSEFGECIFFFGRQNSIDPVYLQWPSNVSTVNDILCRNKYNRGGTLCGSCHQGYYPLAYSYNLTCVKCDNIGHNLIKYVAMAILPLTVFYFVVLFFQVSILQSHIEGFVIFSQAVSFPSMCQQLFLRFSDDHVVFSTVKILGAFYSMWSLEILRLYDNSICLQSSGLVVIFLDILLSLYPMLLILLTYIFIKLYDRGIEPIVSMVKPLQKVFLFLRLKLEIKTSLLDTFSTFLVLSTVKLLSACFEILTPVGIHFLNSEGEKSFSYHLYSNASMTYLGRTHLPYAVVSLVAILAFVIIPGCILVIYPLKVFQRIVNVFPLHLQIFLHTYVDVFYGSYKDGTQDGGKDCRWFASLFFLLRLLLLLAYGYTLNITYFILGTMSLLVVCVLLAVFKPFKQDSRNTSFMIYLLFLAGIYVCILGVNLSSMNSFNMIIIFKLLVAVFFTGPLIYTLGFGLKWIIRRRRFCDLQQLRVARR